MKNNMKIINKIAIFLIFCSCSGEFLEPDPKLTLTLAEYYATLDATSIRAITSNMYGRDWFDYLDKASSCLQELYCGNGHTDDGAYMPFFNGTLNAAFGQLNFLWTTNYGIIKNANASINGMMAAMEDPKSEFVANIQSNPELKAAVEQTLGELRFFRGITYFNLVRWFGPVPLVYDNLKQMADPASLTRVKEEDIYEFIIRDLNEAVTKLPSTRNANKLTKNSAKALLAKVYLTRAGKSFAKSDDFNQAATLADDVITNPAGYGLMTTYHENFLPVYSGTNHPKECLFGWSWSWTSLFGSWGTQNTLQSYYGTSFFNTSWDGWSSVVPSIDLRESFEDNDRRLYSTIMEQGNKYPEFWKEYTFPGQTTPGYVYFAGSVAWGGPSNTGMNIRKHLAGRNGSVDGKIGEMHNEVYTPIIRMADMYLTYAEAKLGKAASTNDAKALERFNTIRQRAGLAPKSSITYKDIWNERRHEFAFEFQNTDDLFRYFALYPEEVKNILLTQKRGSYTSVTEPFKIDGEPQKFSGTDLKVIASKTYKEFKLPAVTNDYFQLPYPLSEYNANAYLKAEPMSFDFVNYK
jgi:starch-binding outer membrane protein, SusD/RagB family